ncbi:UNVERIFIED_CONTAM: hypothetical protein Slati_0220800 [Sesamum latifolium]|uniref:Aminotransferase-like plant mobile domain-containing protein n=1 Tax=Sesamum latifolium TaxID=2727402 RepID=A0AAW2YBZ3_9LAMI
MTVLSGNKLFKEYFLLLALSFQSFVILVIIKGEFVMCTRHFTEEQSTLPPCTWRYLFRICLICEHKPVATQVYDSVYASLFTYDRSYDVIKAFREACCPSTNTLLTSFGELSISLWDLHTLTGLPMNGLLYDEVVPCAKGLDSVDEINFLKFLLTIRSNFSLKESRKEALFCKLGIEGSLKEETFLACWLSTFALPTDGVGSIRPSTFKVASIYKCLNKISGSSRLIRVPSPFLIHFVYSWIAHYFKTHDQVLQGVRGPKMTLFSGEGDAKYYDPQEARKRIYKEVPGILSQDVRRAYLEDKIRYWRLCISSKTMKNIWFPSMSPKCKEVFFRAYKGWWAETHGGFLEENAARFLGSSPIKAPPKDKERGKRVVQDLPRECVASIPPKCNSQIVEVLETSKKKSVSHPLEENETSNLDRYWKRPKRDSNISKPMNVDSDASSHVLSMLNFAKELEDEVIDIEDDEALQDSQESVLGSNLLANTLPIGMGSKAKLPRHAAMSVFEGERFVLNHQKEFFQKMWSDLLVVAYDKARSSSFEKLSKGLLEQQLKEANTRLQDAQVKENEDVSKIQSIMDELERIEKKLVNLKEQRTQLCATLKGQK